MNSNLLAQPRDTAVVVRTVFFLSLIGTALAVVIAPLYAIAAVVGGLAFVFCCSEKRLKYALFALAAYTPFEEFTLKWVPDEFYFYTRFAHYGFIAACLAVIVLRRFAEGHPVWVPTPVDVPLALFLVISVVSLTLNDVPLGAFIFSYQPFLRFIALAFFAIQFIDFSEKDAKRLLMLLFGVVVVEALIGIAQSAIGLTASQFLAPTGRAFMGFEAGGMTQLVQGGRFNIFGTMNRYNTLGTFMAMAIVMSVPFYQSLKHRRSLYLTFLALTGLCLLLAASRAAWLGAVLGVWAIYTMRREAKAFVLPILAILLIFAALSIFSDQVRYYTWDWSEASALQRFLEPFSAEYREKMAGNAYGRIYLILQFPIDVLQYSPLAFLLGFGPGALGSRAMDIYNIYALTPLGIMREWQHYVHDVNWSYILGQVGLLGLLAFLWGLARILRTAAHMFNHSESPFLRQLALSYIGLFAVCFVVAFFYPAWEVRPISLYFWLFGGLIIKFSRSHPAKESH